MRDATFERDDVKAASNMARHGVAFEAACEAFRDPFALDWLDESEDFSEDRFVLVGMAGRRLLFVAYALRGERIRLISARLADPFERRKYHEEGED
jgi:hypothetical protein